MPPQFKMYYSFLAIFLCDFLDSLDLWAMCPSTFQCIFVSVYSQTNMYYTLEVDCRTSCQQRTCYCYIWYLIHHVQAGRVEDAENFFYYILVIDEE